MFVCAFHPEIHSFFGKSFPFLFLFFVLFTTLICQEKHFNLNCLYCVLTKIYSLLIAKDIWESRNLSIKFVCAPFRGTMVGKYLKLLPGCVGRIKWTGRYLTMVTSDMIGVMGVGFEEHVHSKELKRDCVKCNQKLQFVYEAAICSCSYIRGLGNKSWQLFFFFFGRLIDPEETWKYMNGSGWY